MAKKPVSQRQEAHVLNKNTPPVAGGVNRGQHFYRPKRLPPSVMLKRKIRIITKATIPNSEPGSTPQ